MVQAVWSDEVIAESDHTVVERNDDVPRESARQELRRDSCTQSCGPWTGQASHLALEVNSATNEAAAWCYPHLRETAKNITDHVAFWRGVNVA